MKKICSNCKSEYEAERDTSKFCSEACIQKAKRHAKENYDTLTFEDRVSLLEKLSVKELEARGIWIPNWKRAGMSKNRPGAFVNIIRTDVPDTQS